MTDADVTAALLADFSARLADLSDGDLEAFAKVSDAFATAAPDAVCEHLRQLYSTLTAVACAEQRRRGREWKAWERDLLRGRVDEVWFGDPEDRPGS